MTWFPNDTSKPYGRSFYPTGAPGSPLVSEIGVPPAGGGDGLDLSALAKLLSKFKPRNQMRGLGGGGRSGPASGPRRGPEGTMGILTGSGAIVPYVPGQSVLAPGQQVVATWSGG